jgi:uncharacterized protein (DUF2141 family)
MANLKAKLLSVLTAVCLTLSLLPVSASAAVQKTLTDPAFHDGNVGGGGASVCPICTDILCNTHDPVSMDFSLANGAVVSVRVSSDKKTATVSTTKAITAEAIVIKAGPSHYVYSLSDGKLDAGTDYVVTGWSKNAISHVVILGEGTLVVPAAPSAGSLTVTKTVSGLADRSGVYTADITVNGVTKTVSIAAGSDSASVTFTDLPAGTYAVTESSITGVPEGYVFSAEASTVSASAAVTAGGTASASLTNVYTEIPSVNPPAVPPVNPPAAPSAGSLTVTKTVSGLADRSGAYTADITVNGVTKTVSIAAGSDSASVTFTDLPAGTFKPK